MMEREPTPSSSNILSVGYDPTSETLEVEFIRSGIYQYFNVPSFIHEQMMQAASVGSFLNHEIKPHYACAKI